MSEARTKVVVTGATGRMGGTLVRMVRDDPRLVLTGATERRKMASVGLDVGLALGMGALEVQLTDSLDAALERGADVVIDFTSAQASVEHARTCAEKKVALVVGSTGFDVRLRAELDHLAERIPIMLSPNMSVGVNLVIKTAVQLAKVLGESFDIEVLEAHHRHKKDAPSGTALRIAEELAKALGRGREQLKFAREGEVGARPHTEIGVQSLRGGDVVGEHTVFFFGDGERIELTHRATSRDQFAGGALRAAAWIKGRGPGLYNMDDVLGLS